MVDPQTDPNACFTLIRRRHYTPPEGNRSCTLDVFRVASSSLCGTAARVRYFDDAPDGQVPEALRMPVMLGLPHSDDMYVARFIEMFSEQKMRAGYTECIWKHSDKEKRCRVAADELQPKEKNMLLSMPLENLADLQGEDPKRIASASALHSNQSNHSPSSRSSIKKEIPIQVVANYFHLPIHLAAEALGVGETWLKQKCREYKIKRWPYRKVKSLDKAIEKLTTTLRACKDPIHAGEVQRNLEELQRHRKALYFKSPASEAGMKQILGQDLEFESS